MKSFFGGDAGKKTYSEWSAALNRPAFITLQINAEGHDANFFWGNLEVAGHELGVVVADSDERIDVLDLCPNQSQRFAAIRFLQSFQKKIFALQSATNWTTEGLFNRFCETK